MNVIINYCAFSHSKSRSISLAEIFLKKLLLPGGLFDFHLRYYLQLNATETNLARMEEVIRLNSPDLPSASKQLQQTPQQIQGITSRIKASAPFFIFTLEILADIFEVFSLQPTALARIDC